MGALKTETLVVLGVALAVIYMGKVAADKAGAAVTGLEDGAIQLWDATKDVVQAVNPFNENNVVNQAATNAYQAATGSNGTIGGDAYDFTHTGAARNVSWWQLANPATAVGSVIGTGVSDSVKSWWNGL